jgi:Helix-turn-helix domain
MTPSAQVPLHPPTTPAPRVADLPEFLTPEQAAELLQLPVSWIYKQAAKFKAGERPAIPIVKLGKYLRIPRAALIARIQNPDAP